MKKISLTMFSLAFALSYFPPQCAMAQSHSKDLDQQCEALSGSDVLILLDSTEAQGQLVVRFLPDSHKVTVLSGFVDFRYRDFVFANVEKWFLSGQKLPNGEVTQQDVYTRIYNQGIRVCEKGVLTLVLEDDYQQTFILDLFLAKKLASEVEVYGAGATPDLTFTQDIPGKLNGISVTAGLK